MINLISYYVCSWYLKGLQYIVLNYNLHQLKMNRLVSLLLSSLLFLGIQGVNICCFSRSSNSLFFKPLSEWCHVFGTGEWIQMSVCWCLRRRDLFRFVVVYCYIWFKEFLHFFPENFTLFKVSRISSSWFADTYSTNAPGKQFLPVVRSQGGPC